MLPKQCLTLFVERRFGFVEQQYSGVGQAQAGQQRTLQFATGKRLQRLALQLEQAPIAQHLLQTRLPFATIQRAAPEAGADQAVQVDRELLNMTRAAGEFARAQTALAAKFRLVRYAINETR